MPLLHMEKFHKLAALAGSMNIGLYTLFPQLKVKKGASEVSSLLCLMLHIYS